MAPVTRTVVTNGGSEGNLDDGTRRYIDESMAGLRQAMEQMLTNSMEQMMGQFRQSQSQLASGMVNRTQTHENNGQNGQFSRLAKVEFPRFSGDDVRGWMFRCDNWQIRERF